MTTVTTFWIARHGETGWNEEGRSLGHGDPPLNDRGREQARMLARRLSEVRPAAVYASDLRRAAETGAIVAAGVGAPLRVVPALREVDLGEWTGLTDAEVAQRYPGALERWRSGRRAWRQGESYDEMARRVVAALRRIGAAHPASRVAVVAHAGTAIAALAKARRMAFEECRLAHPKPACSEVLVVELRAGAFSVPRRELVETQ